MASDFDARSRLRVGGEDYEIFRLDALQGRWDVARLPYTLRILLENVLRAGDGYYVLDFGSSVQGHLILASYSRSSDDRGAPGAIRAGTCTTATNEGDNCVTGNDPRFVAVYTYASDQTLRQDHSFYVAVV